MKALWKLLCAWVIGLWNYFFRRPPPPLPSPGPRPYRATFIEDDEELPKSLSPDTVYIVGVPTNEWLAVVVCPCGCGATLFLNLLQQERPYWTWHVDTDAAVTLKPSVWRKVGCKSHFFLRDGNIQWCE